MKSKRESEGKNSLGSFSNYANKLYLNNRAIHNMQNLSRANRSQDRSISANQKKRQRQIGQLGNHDEEKAMTSANQRIKSALGNDQEEASAVMSRQDSQTKLSIYDELLGKNRQRKKHGQEKQNKTERNQQKNTHVSILQLRPHQSENLNHVDNKFSAPTHRKLYTFCNENRNFEAQRKGRSRDKSMVRQHPEDQEEQAAKTEQNRDNSTIMIKEEELKRFTHKFAREKIQYEELISNLKKEIRELTTLNEKMVKDKSDLLHGLDYKDEEIAHLRNQVQHLQAMCEDYEISAEQFRLQMRRMVSQKDRHIGQMQNLLAEREREIQWREAEHEEKLKNMQQAKARDSQLSKFCLPLSNIHHAESINTSECTESPAKIQREFLKQVQELRKIRNQGEEKQHDLRKQLSFLKIENEHMHRELQIEKQITNEMKDEIEQLKQKHHQRKERQERPTHSFLQEEQTLKEIQYLRRREEELTHLNAVLLHQKQTLQRSLKVSSEMILCLKQQVDRVKSLPVPAPSSVSLEELRSIIMKMMKEQLELEERHRRSDELMNTLRLSESLQRKYEEGYQSIRRKGRKQQCMTETEQQGQQKPRKNYTEGSFIAEFQSEQSGSEVTL